MIARSHYIGPLNDKEYTTFGTGKAPYNYVLGMPHDGWRLFLPYVIDTYKNKIATITKEGVVAWYRPHPNTACTTGHHRATSDGGKVCWSWEAVLPGKIIRGVLCVLKSPISALKICFRSKTPWSIHVRQLLTPYFPTAWGQETVRLQYEAFCVNKRRDWYCWCVLICIPFLHRESPTSGKNTVSNPKHVFTISSKWS